TPGTTGPSPSSDVFAEIQTKGEAPIVVGAIDQSDIQGLGAIGGLFAARKYFRGTVRKIGVEPVRVVVDGAPAMLETIYVRGDLTVAGTRGVAEFWWLNDAAARLALRFRFQGSTVQVVRIDRPRVDRPGELVGLAGTACRSEVPGIYFLTDSAELLP